MGVVDKGMIINGRKIGNGDSVIGIASNGLHSNGYSLVRKVFFDVKKMSVRRTLPETGCSLGEELLRPTKIYAKAISSLKRRVEIKGMAHITGGGIDGNLPRILPRGHGAVIWENTWPIPPIFAVLRRLGNIPARDMRRTFNMGIGYIVVVSDGQKEKTLSLLGKKGEEAFIIGRVEKGFGGIRYAKN